MKRLLLIFCMACSLFSVQAHAKTDDLSFEGGRLTLNQACQIALKNNPDILEARERINKAKAGVTQEKSLWMPGISAKGHVMAIDTTIQPDWAPEYRITEAFNEYEASLEMHWLVFDGFSRESNIQAASYGVTASEQALENARRLILQAVATTYYQAQIAIEQMKIARQNRAFNRALEKDAKIRYQAGVVPESNVLNFSVRVQKAETDFLAARNAYNLTCTALARLMARDGTSLDEGVQPEISKHDLVHFVPEFEPELAFAETHRPDLAAVDNQLKALSEKYKSAKGAYYPDLYLVSGFDYLYQDQKSVIDEEENSSYVGLSLQWDIFTGFRRSGKVKEAFSKVCAIKERRKKVLLSVQEDIRKAIYSADTAWKTWQQQKQTFEMTKTIRGFVEKAYKAGKEPLTRLNQAQTDYVMAAGAASSARIQYLIAQVKLDAATGRLNEQWSAAKNIKISNQ